MGRPVGAFDPALPWRQYRVAHRGTGETWLVNVNGFLGRHADGGPAFRTRPVSARLGWKYPADCDVVVVARGDEIALPFDLPVRIHPPRHPDARPVVGRIAAVAS